MYDALNVLMAMDIIKKEGNEIEYNEDNEFIDDDVFPNTKPDVVFADKISEDKIHLP